MKHLKANCVTTVSKMIADEGLALAAPLDVLFRYGSVFHGPAESVWPHNYIKPTRLFSDREVRPGDYVRVHVNPRFYPEFENIDWRSRIVKRTDEFVILNKPAGIPSHSTSDNGIQNCLDAVKLELECEVWLPHRLDTDTSGILIVCTSRDYLSSLNEAMRKRNVVKRYKAIVASTEPLDHMFSGDKIWQSWLRKSGKCPKEYLAAASEDTLSCGLKVVSFSRALSRSRSEWLQWSETSTSCGSRLRLAMAAWTSGGCSRDSSSLVSLREVEFELMTGRTHQIRGQTSLLAQGCHIGGDNMYRGVTTSSSIDKFFSSSFLALQAVAITFGDLEAKTVVSKEQKRQLKKRRAAQLKEVSAGFDGTVNSLDTGERSDDGSVILPESSAPSHLKARHHFELSGDSCCWWSRLSRLLHSL